MREIPDFVVARAKASDPIFCADEVNAWPSGLFEDLIQRGILKPTDNAQSITCDACGHDHVEHVEFVSVDPTGETRAFIRCSEAGRVKVDLNRLRRWTVRIEGQQPQINLTVPDPDLESVTDPIRMTITEAAKFVGVTDRTIREWRLNGKLTVAENESGHLVFSKSTLQMLRDSR